VQKTCSLTTHQSCQCKAAPNGHAGGRIRVCSAAFLPTMNLTHARHRQCERRPLLQRFHGPCADRLNQLTADEKPAQVSRWQTSTRTKTARRAGLAAYLPGSREKTEPYNVNEGRASAEAVGAVRVQGWTPWREHARRVWVAVKDVVRKRVGGAAELRVGLTTGPQGRRIRLVYCTSRTSAVSRTASDSW
jgi:hypothetical protein